MWACIQDQNFHLKHIQFLRYFHSNCRSDVAWLKKDSYIWYSNRSPYFLVNTEQTLYKLQIFKKIIQNHWHELCPSVASFHWNYAFWQNIITNKDLIISSQIFFFHFSFLPCYFRFWNREVITVVMPATTGQWFF